MDGEQNKNFQPKPLTKISKETGNPYFRRDETVSEIIKTINYSKAGLLEKLEDLKSETLVFLFREKYQADYEIAGKIWEILAGRIWKLAGNQKIKFNNAADFEDFVMDIQVRFFQGIGNLESDAFDYAQASFGEFIKGFILNKSREKKNVREREKQTIWLDEETENDEARTPFQLIAKMTNSEKELIFRQALHKLPGEILEVCILYYLDGWQIHSKDPDKITIAKLYGKSEKTIRNWIFKAGEILVEYRGELR